MRWGLKGQMSKIELAYSLGIMGVVRKFDGNLLSISCATVEMLV